MLHITKNRACGLDPIFPIGRYGIGHIKQWPSSTRVELGAILSVLLILPSHQSANIYTDSKVAIDSIMKLKLGLKGGKILPEFDWSKTTNNSLISSIEYILYYQHRIF